MIFRNDFGVSQYALLFKARGSHVVGFNAFIFDDPPGAPNNSTDCVMFDDIDEPTSVIEKLLVDTVSTNEQKCNLSTWYLSSVSINTQFLCIESYEKMLELLSPLWAATDGTSRWMLVGNPRPSNPLPAP